MNVTDSVFEVTSQISLPVHPEQVAESLGFVVRFDPLPSASRGFLIREDHTIVVNAFDRPERQNFTIAHEIGEFKTPEKLPAVKREKWADEFAAELLLPSDLFKEYGRECGWDLGELKLFFHCASWEVIARRTLKYHPSVITIVDNRKIYFRRGSGMRFPVKLMPEEIEAMETNSKVLSDQCIVRIWSVVEETERVFLMTEMVE